MSLTRARYFFLFFMRSWTIIRGSKAERTQKHSHVETVSQKHSLFSHFRYSKPGPGPNVKFLPEVESVRNAVEELKKMNINKIIAIGHAGIDMDKKIAKEVDGIDIVVGGHSNTFLYTGNARGTHVLHSCYKQESTVNT